MTPEENIARNEALRTRFSGGVVALSPSVLDLPDWFRGRVLYRLTLPHKFITPDQSRGCFVFGGWCFYWQIDEQPELTLSLYMAEDL